MSWSNWKMDDLIRRAKAKQSGRHDIREFIDDTLTARRNDMAYEQLRRLMQDEPARKEKPMAYQEQVGRTNLFRNDKKGNEKAPDYKGKVEVLVTEPGIVTIDLALWERTSEKAGTFLGLSATAKNVRPNEDVTDAFRA